MQKAIDLKLATIIEDNYGNKTRINSLVLDDHNKNAITVTVTTTNGFKFFVGFDTYIKTYNEEVMHN